MVGYRLFFLDKSGRVERAMEFEFVTDEDAIETAIQYRDGQDLELWSGARMVEKFPKLDEG